MGNKNEKIVSKPGIKFSEIKDQLKPFDIIVFRGTEFVSDTISLFEKLFLGNGDWTHVGIVITSDFVKFKNSVPNKLYIWESTMSGPLSDGVDNIETGKGDFGVQIRNLEKVIDKFDKNTNSKIGWCQLINNPINKKENESDDDYNSRILILKQKLQEFYFKHGNDLYDFRLSSLLKSLISNFPQIGHNDHMFFCSELVTKIFEIIGIIDSDIDPETMAPVELIEGSNPFVKIPPIIITREW